MNIHDLTRGKFSQMYQYLTGYEYETSQFFAFQRLFSNRVDIEQRLDQIPVFLVESSRGKIDHNGNEVVPCK